MNRQEGSIISITIFILLLMTIIGIASISTTNIELMITSNERVYKENLYKAEAAAMKCAQFLQITDLQPDSSITGVIFSNGPNENNILDAGEWNSSGNSSAHSSAPINSVSEARRMAVYQGIAPDSSLDVSKSRVHMFSIYGRGHKDDGRVVVKLGFRKPY
jgi:Tfp pilus assembly protein PilX